MNLAAHAFGLNRRFPYPLRGVGAEAGSQPHTPEFMASSPNSSTVIQ